MSSSATRLRAILYRAPDPRLNEQRVISSLSRCGSWAFRPSAGVGFPSTRRKTYQIGEGTRQHTSL